MPFTQEEYDDLVVRLEGLVGEYAAASDRRAGVAKLHAILAKIPVATGPFEAQGALQQAQAALAAKPTEMSPETIDETPA